MKNINEMGDFRESAQRNYDNACVAFSAANKCAPIERVTGIKKLADKLNPGQEHKLSIMDVKLITKATGDYSIVNSFLLSLDMVAVNVNRESNPETLVKRALQNSIISGKLAEQTLENGGEIRLPRRKAQALLDVCNAGIANLVLLANDLENRTSGSTPFLSMTTDFVMQYGAPGLI